MDEPHLSTKNVLECQKGLNVDFPMKKQSLGLIWDFFEIDQKNQLSGAVTN